MNPSEKLVSLEKYAQTLKDRLSSANYPKRDNSSFLKLDLTKTQKKIDQLRLDGAGSSKK